MDYYDASRTGSKAAFELINKALEHGAELVYTVPSSKDVFYLIGRAYKGVLRTVNQERSSEDLAAVAREMAWGCVRNMSEIATAVDAMEEMSDCRAQNVCIQITRTI